MPSPSFFFARGRTALGAAVLALFLCSLPGCNECLPGECEPCVGETCDVTCVEPDSEDIAYSCLWPCSDGADCSLACEGVDCNLACSASSCACSYCDAHCTDGSDCRVSGHSRIGCDGSTCDSQCQTERHNLFASCAQACVNGSTCSLTCGDPAGVEAPGKCRMSCDATSSCQLACHGQCSLCCNGSPDCTLDCPGGATTCDDGTLMCGAECGEDFVSGEPEDRCPVFADSWIQE